MSRPDENAVRDALRSVADPEVGIDIVELGLVYAIEISERGIRIDMTTTSPACPTADMMLDQARTAVARIAGDLPVEVVQVWEPAWTPERMSDAAKRQLGW